MRDALSSLILCAALVVGAFVLLEEPKAHAQSVDGGGLDVEAVTVVAPGSLTFRAFGETTSYLLDGGCMCQPVSRVAVPPYPCNGTCAISRARSRGAVSDAVDAGGFAP